MESPETISFNSYFFVKSLIPIFFALALSFIMFQTEIYLENYNPYASKAAAARTPSGPPPIPKKISILYFSSVTIKAPETSPSEINFRFTFNFFKFQI